MARRKSKAGNKAAPGKSAKKPAEAAKPRARTSGTLGGKEHRPLIIGIGASAGGLEAFKNFFDHMRSDSGMAFVLVQHLDPDHQSMLADLLASHTDMPVAEAEDDMLVEGNHVYIIPPDATLTIESGRLQLETPAPARAGRHPIDTFFGSLAADQGEGAVCVVLSGAGSDGTLGLKQIKAQGGFALAQEGPDNSAERGMPASAAATGLVDYCVPVKEMPGKLLDYHHHMRRVAKRKGSDGTRRDAADYLDTITGIVHNELGHDFSGYKENTMVRRIQRRMQVLQIDAVPQYIDLIRARPQELKLLFDDLLIGVTQFFRDPEAWAALKKEVIPEILEGKHAADEVRLWAPGCGTGEEAYSLAILVEEALEESDASPRVQIFGTDIDARAIEMARAGTYHKELPGLSTERRERFFVQNKEGEYRANKTIRAMCVFAEHSVIKDPPFSRLDLVCCRNLMIYMRGEPQDRIVREFHYALKPGGWLFLGASEGVSRNGDLFKTVDKKHRLFRRRETGRRTVPDLAPTAPAPRSRQSREIRRVELTGQTRARGDSLDRRARAAMQKYALPYIVIGASREILGFSGGTIGEFLEPSPGTANFELLEMVKKALRPAVRESVQRAFDRGEPQRRENVPLRINASPRAVTVIVEPLATNRRGVQQCVVAFRETGRTQGGPGGGEEGADVVTLEHELRVTKAQLNSAISDLETANEELRSANEEYQSVNEELQSSNEELETSKEEMQSVNEELQTVNAELVQRTDSLTKANSDLRNLLESTQIATLFLDRELSIKSFTPGMQELFHLRDGDRGRPVTDIVTRLDYRALDADAKKVLRDLNLVEREVSMTDGDPQTFIMRIRPYRTVDNVIDGVVVTFTDITERKRGEVERVRLAELVRSSHDAIIGHSLEGEILSWNPAAERIFGYAQSEAVGKPMRMLIPEDCDDEVPDLLERLKHGETVDKYDVTRERRDGRRVQVELTISPVRDEHGAMMSASTVARDISARLEESAHRELLISELSHRVKNTLATVQSIMVQTARSAEGIEEFKRSLGDRLAALSKTHNLLVRGQWRSIDLAALVRLELEPYVEDGHPAWSAEGPAVRIGPTEAVPLGMALHELTTNAVKHGSLSNGKGRVALRWSLEDKRATPRRLVLSWNEYGGPATHSPDRRGFGLRMIEEGLRHELQADVDLDFACRGLNCAIRMPLRPLASGRQE